DAARKRLGVGTINMKKAPLQVPRMLRAGRAVGIVFDQDAGKAGISVPFFGHPASTHRGPALFALRFGAPVFSSIVRRRPDGRYDIIMDRVPYSRTDDLEKDILRLTTDLSSRLEEAVRDDPEQYFWFHKRWKTNPDKEIA
ncbi:MAG TPA: lysophospholipid acyltransferase family protein, partial [Longimicrobiaceae bacterium]|nr:lysophospholipid acyltransferase family protein [Longimicrobiaceae bacterium]